MSVDEDLRRVEAHFGVDLPADYKNYVREHGAFSDFLGNDFLSILPAAELIAYSEAAELQMRCPKVIVIGSDGSRELLAFDFRSAPPCLVLLDIAAADWSAAMHQAETFTSFLEAFEKRGWIFNEPSGT